MGRLVVLADVRFGLDDPSDHALAIRNVPNQVAAKQSACDFFRWLEKELPRERLEL